MFKVDVLGLFQLAAEYDKTRAKEIELLKQQENFIRRSCETEKELKKKKGGCEGTRDRRHAS